MEDTRSTTSNQSTGSQLSRAQFDRLEEYFNSRADHLKKEAAGLARLKRTLDKQRPFFYSDVVEGEGDARSVHSRRTVPATPREQPARSVRSYRMDAATPHDHKDVEEQPALSVRSRRTVAATPHDHKDVEEQPTPSVRSRRTVAATPRDAEEHPALSVRSRRTVAATPRDAEEQPAPSVRSRRTVAATPRDAEEQPAPSVRSRRTVAATPRNTEEQPAPSVRSRRTVAATPHHHDEQPAPSVRSRRTVVATPHDHNEHEVHGEQPAESVHSRGIGQFTEAMVRSIRSDHHAEGKDARRYKPLDQQSYYIRTPAMSQRGDDYDDMNVDFEAGNSLYDPREDQPVPTPAVRAAHRARDERIEQHYIRANQRASKLYSQGE